MRWNGTPRVNHSCYGNSSEKTVPIRVWLGDVPRLRRAVLQRVDLEREREGELLRNWYKSAKYKRAILRADKSAVNFHARARTGVERWHNQKILLQIEMPRAVPSVDGNSWIRTGMRIVSRYPSVFPVCLTSQKEKNRDSQYFKHRIATSNFKKFRKCDFIK